MELSGRPLFDNPVDAALFVDREEATRLESNCRDGVNTLVLGGRGTGKTSLMRNVLYRLREADFPAVGVDAAPAEDVLDLLRLIEVALGRLRYEGPQLDPHTVAGIGEIGTILRKLRGLSIESESPSRRTAVLIDLPPGNTKMHRLFGRFRDELWQLPFIWIVVAPQEQRIKLLTPPADAFFEDVIELAPLSLQQQTDLIQRRLEPGEQTSWRLHSEGEDNPRRLLEIVRESIRNDEGPDRRFDAMAERDREVGRLGAAAGMLYTELENYGPASASDKDFLSLLGWSRQRAAQVLQELERADLVRSESRRSEGGRPRKVFYIVPPPNQ
jgi:hypothetical protein